MKRISIVLLLVGCLASAAISSANAQDTTSTLRFKKFTVGPSFTAGGSVFTGPISTGFKTSGEFSFDGGVLAYYQANESFGFMLGIDYDVRNINFHQESDASVYNNISLGYLAIEPGFKFKDFTLGLGIGIPMSASGTATATSTASPTTFDIATDQIATLIEIRIGATVPISESPTGDFRFLVNASYPFTNTFNKLLVGGATQPFFKNDGPVPTLRGGFCYLFSLGS